MNNLKLLKIDFVELQKAMEDVSRESLDYFLDIETGNIITISVDALRDAEELLCKNLDESTCKFIEDFDMPEWMEEEVELAVKIFSEEKDRYVRIPERESKEAYSLMKEFAEKVEDLYPYEELTAALNSRTAFSRFKKVLAKYPAYRGRWFALNARAMEKIITEWLASIGVKPEQAYY